MGIRPTPCDNWVQGQYAKCAHAPLHPSQYLTVLAAEGSLSPAADRDGVEAQLAAEADVNIAGANSYDN